MRSYIAVSGLIFLLILVGHGVRAAAEGPGTLQEPIFLLSSFIAAGLAIWAAILLRRPKA
jgi:hypothetical protein